VRACARARPQQLARSVGPQNPKTWHPTPRDNPGEKRAERGDSSVRETGPARAGPPPEISCARELARGVFACRDSGPPAGATRAVALAVGARTSHARDARARPRRRRPHFAPRTFSSNQAQLAPSRRGPWLHHLSSRRRSDKKG
jgi:hypothetical protein